MNRRSALAAVCAALAVEAGPVPASAQGRPPADLSLASRVVVASKIYALLQQYWAHWSGVSRPEVEAAYRQYAGELASAPDRRAFDLATLKFVAQLHNSHTQFSDDELPTPPLGFRLLLVEGRWVVISSADSRLHPGDVVRTLQGLPVADFVKERAGFVAASNERIAETHVFSNGLLFPDQVSVGLQDGPMIVIDRTAKAEAPTPAPPPKPASEGRWLTEGKLAYIRIPSFGDPAFEKTALDLVRAYGSATALVVDVRGNGGGATPGALLQALMNRPWRTWRQATPQSIALLEAEGVPAPEATWPAQPVTPRADAYRGRVIILADRFCGSACEDFVMPFRETGRGVVIGETTQGSSGNPYRVDLGDGMHMSVGAVRYRFPDGAAFESVGITPDIPVDLTIADLKRGRDAVLERAQMLAAGEG